MTTKTVEMILSKFIIESSKNDKNVSQKNLYLSQFYHDTRSRYAIGCYGLKMIVSSWKCWCGPWSGKLRKLLPQLDQIDAWLGARFYQGTKYPSPNSFNLFEDKRKLNVWVLHEFTSDHVFHSIEWFITIIEVIWSSSLIIINVQKTNVKAHTTSATRGKTDKA